MNKLVLGIVSFFALLTFVPFQATAGLILSVDYEDGTFGKADKSNSTQTTTTGYPSLCCSHSARVVTSPVRNGTRAVKMTLLPTDEGYIYGGYGDPATRAEFEKWNIAHIGDTRWYAFSVYLDSSYLDTSTDPNGTIVFQSHTNRDSCDVGKSPHLEIHVTTGLQWRVRQHSDSNPCTTSVAPNRIDWNLGPAAKGVWVDWVIYAKWSYQSDGILKVWKDGKQVIERFGPNKYNDQHPEFVKWGVYKSWWGVKPPPLSDRLIVYHDEIKVGDANSTYAEVAPKSSQSTTPWAPDDLRVSY